jgi:phage gp36-like protein
MPDTPAAPASGGTSAPSVSSAPGSGASSAPSSPATPATPSTPAAPAAAAPASAEPKSQLDKLRDELAKVPQNQFEAALAGKKPEEKPPEAVAAEEPKPGEPAKVEEPKPGEPAKPEAVAPNPLDKIGPLPAETIAKAFDEDPAFAAQMAAKGLDKDTLVANARLAAETSQYKAIAPTLAAAKHMQENAAHFYDVEDGFLGIKDMATFDSFIMDRLLPLSAITGEDGQPLKTADGKAFQTDGSVTRFIDMAGQFWTAQGEQTLRQLATQATSDEDKGYYEALADAAQEIQKFAQNGYRKPGSAPAAVSPEVQARLDAADRELKDSRARDAKTKEAGEKVFEGSVLNDTVAVGSTMAGAIVNMTGLNDALKTKATSEIFSECAKWLAGNREYNRLKSIYFANFDRGQTEQARKDLVALNREYLEIGIPIAAEKVLPGFGAVVDRNKAKHETIDTQINRDRMNPSSVSAAAAPGGKAITEEQLQAQARQNVLAKHDGRITSTFNQEFMTEVVKLRQARTA